MISRLDFIALITATGVLFITKPTQAEVEAELKTAIIANINAAQLNEKGDFLSGFLTLGCKFEVEACYQIVRAAAQVSYKDRLLFASVGIAMDGAQRNCIGAFKNLFCPKFLN